MSDKRQAGRRGAACSLSSLITHHLSLFTGIIDARARLLQRGRPSALFEERVVVGDEPFEPRLQLGVVERGVHVLELRAAQTPDAVVLCFEPLAARARLLRPRALPEGFDAGGQLALARV